MKKTYFPAMHQVFVIPRNENYFHSLWIGLTAPVLNIWTMLFFTVLLPVLKGLGLVLHLLIVIPIMGILGKLSAANVTLDEAVALHQILRETR